MRVDTLTTSVITVQKIVYIQERQDGTDDLNVVPTICVNVCTSAVRQAQMVGLNMAALCPPDGDFVRSFNACQDCITINKPDLPNRIPPLLPSLAQFVEFCDIRVNSTLVSEISKSVAESAGFCAGYSAAYGVVANNCSSSSIAYTTITPENLTSSAPASQQPENISTSTSPPIPTEKDSESHTGEIAGGVVGGVVGLLLIGAALFLIRRHRRRKTTLPDLHEKAQLHADELKPNRKELEGSKASRKMLEKQGIVAEMAANEEVEDKNKKLEEMPSNEAAGHEMETAENEIRALDRLAQESAGDTTLVSSDRSDYDQR